MIHGCSHFQNIRFVLLHIFIHVLKVFLSCRCKNCKPDDKGIEMEDLLTLSQEMKRNFPRKVMLQLSRFPKWDGWTGGKSLCVVLGWSRISIQETTVDWLVRADKDMERNGGRREGRHLMRMPSPAFRLFSVSRNSKQCLTMPPQE